LSKAGLGVMEQLRKGRLWADAYYHRVDKPFYRERLEDFLPRKMIDIHAHATSPAEIIPGAPAPSFWAERVCPNGMTVEALLESYRLLFPGKEVRPVIFPYPSPRFDPAKGNEYVSKESRRLGLRCLILTDPAWSAEELERYVEAGGFVGLKPYPSMARGKTPERVEIYDFLPTHHLELADRKRWLIILHIPRPGRLMDQVNLRQLMELDRTYPRARVVVAHVGRSYCDRYAESLDELADSRNLLFDISANANQLVFERLIDTVGTERVLFGSDLPVTAMHSRRICEGDNYVNIILDADWEDNHTRIGQPEDEITFFLYEAIDAFRRAADRVGLGRKEIEMIFFRNAERLVG